MNYTHGLYAVGFILAAFLLPSLALVIFVFVEKKFGTTIAVGGLVGIFLTFVFLLGTRI